MKCKIIYWSLFLHICNKYEKVKWKSFAMFKWLETLNVYSRIRVESGKWLWETRKFWFTAKSALAWGKFWRLEDIREEDKACKLGKGAEKKIRQKYGLLPNSSRRANHCTVWLIFSKFSSRNFSLHRHFLEIQIFRTEYLGIFLCPVSLLIYIWGIVEYGQYRRKYLLLSFWNTVYFV